MLKHSSQVPDPSEHVKSLLEQAKPEEIYVKTDEMEDHTIDAEKQEKNEQIHQQINVCLQEQLSQTNLLKDHLLELYIRRNEHFAL